MKHLQRRFMRVAAVVAAFFIPFTTSTWFKVINPAAYVKSLLAQ